MLSLKYIVMKKVTNKPIAYALIIYVLLMGALWGTMYVLINTLNHK